MAGTRQAKKQRQQLISRLAAQGAISSQEELVKLLAARGFDATQATVSRDIAELGLVKSRGDGHTYTTPADLARTASTDDEQLRRVLTDLPVTIKRSGLILLLVSTPGTAPVIAEAIDRSSLHEQEGTIAGDNTVLVLFADAERLESWRQRIARIAGPGVR
jgi:transcriptional regulator of arginine metabolism